MLVLTRKAGETVIIGDAVLTILSTNSKQIQIGIEAPAETQILRGELALLPAPAKAAAKPRREKQGRGERKKLTANSYQPQPLTPNP